MNALVAISNDMQALKLLQQNSPILNIGCRLTTEIDVYNGQKKAVVCLFIQHLLLCSQEQWQSIVMSMSVCVCVCVSVCKHISQTTRVIFTKVFVRLPISVARSSIRVIQSQGEGQFSVFFPTDNAVYGPYSGMNFTTKDRSGLNLLIYHNVGQNSISYY